LLIQFAFRCDSELTEALESVQTEYGRAKDTILSCRSEVTETEQRLQTIQTEFFAIQANEQALVAHNESLLADNAYLKKQVDELVPKLSASSRDVVSLRGQLNDQTELVLELRRAAEDYESRMLQIKSSFEAYESAETEIVTEMREVAELLASTVGVDPSAAAPPHAALPASRTRHGHVGMDLFASPPLAIMRSPLNLYSTAATEGTNLAGELTSTHSDVLAGAKYNVSSLKARASNLLAAYEKTYDSLEKTVRERDDLRRDFDRAKEKIQLAAYDREAILGKLNLAEETQEALRGQLEELRERNAAWANGHTSSSQRISTVLRELDSQLLESLAKANDAVAGVIPINTDSLPNLSISEALIQFDEARGRVNFHDAVPAGNRLPDPDHHSSTAVLTVSVSEVHRATEYLLSTIRNLVRECKHRGEAVTKAESAVDVKEAIWERDRKQLFEQQGQLEDELAALQTQHAHLAAELESTKTQLERASHRVADLLDHNSNLDGELSEALSQRNELKQDLSRVEASCLELRNKLRAAQLEADKRSEDLNVVNEQFEEMQRRITEGELNHERLNTVLGRTRAEKDALDNVRRSLESELERSRAEVISLKESTQAVEDEHRSSFEVEKVLAALATTMDQIVGAGSSAGGLRNSLLLNTTTEHTTEHALITHAHASVNSSFVSVDSHRGGAGAAAHAQSDVPLTARVEAAVKRLSNLRHWARDEARSKRLLEGQLEAAGADTAAAQATAEDAQRQVKQLLQAAAARDKDLREKTAELQEREHEALRLQDELDRLRSAGTSITGRLEDEKRHGLSLAEQIAAKEHECARLTGELEAKNLAVTKLQSLLQAANEQLAAAVDESERRAEQLRVAKSNSERIMATLEQVERGAASDKAERESAEKRAAEAEEQLGALSRMRARNAELEQKLTATKEECKLVSRAKVVAEELNTTLQQDLQGAVKKVASLEHRIDSIMQEKNTFVDEVAETRRKIALAKQYADQERAQRMKADATMALLKRSGEESRVDLVEYATMAEEAGNQQSRAEEEKRSLRSKINELKQICDEKESLRLTEMGDRKKMESDIQQLKAALAKRNAELASSSNYSAQLRAEGRHARQLVMNAVKQIREILIAVRADAKATGADVLSNLNAEDRTGAGDGAAGEVSYDDALPLGLGEALGINDLTESLDTLREAMHYISAAPVNRQTLQARVAQLEADNANIHKELLSSETKRTELVSRYKEEIQTMHLHLTELRRTDSKNPHLTHQIAELEGVVRQERERREKAQAEVTLLRSRLEQAASLQQQHHHRPADVSYCLTHFNCYVQGS
jgi:chromosome segregation ATPase